MTSTTKAAKAALFTTLTANLNGATSPDGSQVLVTYDEPTPEYLPQSVIAVRKVSRGVRVAAMVGSMAIPGALQDDVIIHVTVSCYAPGDHAQATFERCCDLVDAVEAVVRTDPSLSGAALSARVLEVEYGEAAWTDDGKGRLAEADMQVSATALY